MTAGDAGPVVPLIKFTREQNMVANARGKWRPLTRVEAAAGYTCGWVKACKNPAAIMAANERGGEDMTPACREHDYVPATVWRLLALAGRIKQYEEQIAEIQKKEITPRRKRIKKAQLEIGEIAKLEQSRDGGLAMKEIAEHVGGGPSARQQVYRMIKQARELNGDAE